MPNLNKVLLMGNLTRDPELKYLKSGVAVADVGMAINRRYNTQDGEKKEETCFVDITFWAKRAETVVKYLKKGNPLLVEGRLQLDQWETDKGERRSKLKVVADSFEFIGTGAKKDDEGEEKYIPAGTEPALSTASQDVPF